MRNRPSVRIFVSHAEEDVALAALFIDTLQASMRLDDDEILSSSVPGYVLAEGEGATAIKAALSTYSAVIVLATSAATSSRSVLFELGTAWGAERTIFPLVASNAAPEDLPGPLQAEPPTQLSDAEGLTELLRAASITVSVSRRASSDMEAAIRRFVAALPPLTSASSPSPALSSPRAASQAPAPSTPRVASQAAAPRGLAPDPYANAEAIIRAHCTEKWPDDFEMLAYCIDEQRAALATLKERRPADIPADIFQRIRDAAAEKWPDDFEMREYTEEQQCIAYRKINP